MKEKELYKLGESQEMRVVPTADDDFEIKIPKSAKTLEFPCIYKITNKKNNKIYIGQTSNFKKRIKSYRTVNSAKRSHPIYVAIRESGKSNFTIEPICICHLEDLNERERFYIREYDSMNPDIGYNRTAGNYSLGTSKSLEIERKRLAHIGLKESVATKRKKSNVILLHTNQ